MLARRIQTSTIGACSKPQRRMLGAPISARVIVPRSRQVTCQGLFGLGLPEVAVIAGVAALIFGPSKLPELGKSLGKTVKSFQTAANEFSEELKAGMADDTKKPAAEEPKKTDSN
ncbi:hypothetical protein VaNZ11_007157 [Volvox africanus]|uniref:Uncharacterized protein n=1 Tax=Volvox africanus TaxID=51714 RepID=A0ABQ5S3G5_9CHLO|nr:hypothetical protein VaNZ11_007157 [Volvox africanus]